MEPPAHRATPPPQDSYWLTRWVILRLLGFVYAAAFFSAARQILPLIGSHGLLPLDLFLHRVQAALGSQAAGFFRLPSLFWIVHSDVFLQGAAWAGFALSCIVMAGYGAFGSVGRERLNVVFEGTDATPPDAGSVWKAYPYLALPVALHQRPRQIAPYQPRLDWQMWFAAMGTPDEYPWTLHLVWKLLRNDPGALSLFGGNPFPQKPPRYVRAVLYRYRFARPGNPEGNCWQREELGLWLPPLSAQDPRLLQLLKDAGWLERTN